MQSNNVIDIQGVLINAKTNIVVDGTKPVTQRYYRSSVLPKNISCYDDHLQKFQNVELFQPVIYDLDNPMPKYNRAWEVYDNPNIKKKKLIRINYPKVYLEWWYEQRNRCLNGYKIGGVLLSGANYWYLNFWRIKTKEKGKGLIPPMFIDMDKEFFDLLEKAKDNDKNLLCLKRRQIGFTEKMAALCALEALLYPSSQTLIVAGLDDYAANCFGKVVMGIDSLSPLSQEQSGREFYKRKLKDIPQYAKFGFEAAGVQKGYLSEIFAITTKDNAQAASGKSPTLVFMEEAGINPLLKRVYNMIQPSIEQNGVQNGRINVIVGTGGEMKKGVADLMDMFYKPDKYNLLSVKNIYEPGASDNAVCCPFFPAWYFYVMDNDGNSYKEQGIELLKAKRKKLGNNKKDLHEEKTQMPLTPTEAFSTSGLSPFNTEKLERQLQKLLSENWEEKTQYGKFEEILENGKLVGSRWIAAPLGMEDAIDHEGDFMYPFIIIEHPDRPEYVDSTGYEYYSGSGNISGLYGAGTDSYDKDEANASDSMGSFVMFKGYHSANKTSMMPVARLTWRPIKKEKFYKQTALACIYYGDCENLIEWSNVSIFDYYKNNDFEHLLKERPEIAYATIKDSKVNNRYGVDPNTKPVWIEHFSSYVEDYYDNIYDLTMVQHLRDFRSRDHNCDITISVMLGYECILDDIKKGYDKVVESTNSVMFTGYVKRNGRFVRV
jgi:hypothetical protein